FSQEELEELAASIRSLGVVQPVVVRPLAEAVVPGAPVRYELIAGERRWRAARQAGLEVIPALMQAVTDVSALERAVVENLHREDLSPLEEAAAYQQLIEDFNFTHDQLAERVGRSRATITNTLRLFHLPPTVQRMVGQGELDAGHARALLGTGDRAFQESLARRVVGEGLSVRAVEEAVRAREGGARRRSPRRAPTGSPRPAALVELEELLAARLDTRVSVEMGSTKGRVVVEFATLADLERIYRAMVGGDPHASSPQAETDGDDGGEAGPGSEADRLSSGGNGSEQ
ncbi:MAG TPA: ParB/RepB/Spo0J family partition protein, partial [Acidimicrobiales bacterium]|nr:ParB/RepB/Spo0J family partition protein [Acidimicrobiales bacterium]